MAVSRASGTQSSFRRVKDRVERIWRREGLKIPKKQKARGRLWFNDGSCVRLRPQHQNHVWSYDFVSTRTYDGRAVRMLNLIDEHTRECLLIRPERRWSSARVIEALADVMVMKGIPEYLRSDNGPEFVAKELRKWLADTGANTLYIEPGSPWENGCQWRQLPSDFPPWKTVHEHFRMWRDSGVWERVKQALREQGRKASGRNTLPSVAIVDSQSAKTVLKGGAAVTTRARRSKGASGISQSIRKATCWR